MKAKVGDNITMADSWCKSVQADYDTANRKGVVLSTQKIGTNNQYCKIKWDDGSISGALSTNLQKTTIYCPCGFPQSTPEHEHNK